MKANQILIVVCFLKKKINKIIKLKSPVEKRNEHDSIEKVYDDYL